MRCRTQKLKEITTVHGTDIIQIKEELTALHQQLTNEDVMSTNDTSFQQTADQSFIREEPAEGTGNSTATECRPFIDVDNQEDTREPDEKDTNKLDTKEVSNQPRAMCQKHFMYLVVVIAFLLIAVVVVRGYREVKREAAENFDAFKTCNYSLDMLAQKFVKQNKEIAKCQDNMEKLEMAYLELQNTDALFKSVVNIFLVIFILICMMSGACLYAQNLQLRKKLQEQSAVSK